MAPIELSLLPEWQLHILMGMQADYAYLYRLGKYHPRDAEQAVEALARYREME